MDTTPHLARRLQPLHRIRRILAASLLLASAWSGSAAALDCGTNNGYLCQGTQAQYAGGFAPGVGYGGFGGGTVGGW